MLTRLLRRFLPRRSTVGTTFVSFAPILAKVCDEIRPRAVLEFGPGTSTQTILAHSSARIVSIEESEEWFRQYRRQFPADRVTVLHKSPPWDLRELDHVGGPYDLIFVDGGDRAAELRYCAALLTDLGVVGLHDAHRENYEPGLRAYPYVYFPERHSCLLCKSPATFARLKAAIPQDWSCRCRYCDTPERNRYLSEFEPPAQT